MRILIAGGGIGGLSAALSLHAAGFTDVRIVEAATTIWPLGVGLNILPNAVRELTELGLYDRLAERAVITRELRFYSRHGRLIRQEPRGRAAGCHWPQLSIHRGDLQTVLAQAVRERLGTDAIVNGTRVVGCSPLPDAQVAVTTVRAGTGTVKAGRADLVIGADGIRSAVRASFYPEEGPPPSNGMVVWRGTTWAEPFLTGESMIVTGDGTRRIALYPVARHPTGTRVLVNWVAARPAATTGDRPTRRDEGHGTVTTARVLEHFGDWAFDWLDIPALLGGARRVHQHPMVDRDPLPRWTFGNVTLLGDAAHAMYPMGSNGATQSIIDARVLAHALATADDIPQALARYEGERRPAMTRLQADYRRQGPESVTKVHQRAPDGFRDLREVMSERELAQTSARCATASGLEREYVNTRPALPPPSVAAQGSRDLP
ncbi:FAD-dependent monooxygenase [Streptomyces sp. 2A115]|uniref:FAD-dependent monooxygenase n=1 Tax=Streptomyces sp. 2A115 TaxID=3457439 RepID=UPI003FD4A199